MRIEVLYIPNCPNHAVALERLRAILTSEGLQAHISEVLVNDAMAAQSLKFPGSPTILINGRDIEPQDERFAPFGLTCRLYVDGGGAPIPSETTRRNPKGTQGRRLMKNWRITGTSAGAMLSSLLALGCCLPLPFLGAASLAAASVFLSVARPWLLGLSVVLLGTGFFQAYRGMKCRARQSRTALVLLGLTTILVVSLLFFPRLVAGWLADIPSLGQTKAPAEQSSLVTLTSSNFDELRTEFNAASGDVRVVLLLSPT